MRKLVIDILELDGLGIPAIRQAANAVWPHLLKRDAVLGGLFLFVGAVGTGNRCLDLLFLLPSQPPLLLSVFSFPSDDSVNFPVQICLPFHNGIKIVCLVRPLLGAQHRHLQQVADELFQRLAVFLIDAQQKEGQHDQHHTQGGHAGACLAFEQKEKRHTDQRTAAKTDQLSFGQVEQDLGFHPRQVLGYRYISHWFLLLMVSAPEILACSDCPS